MRRICSEILCGSQRLRNQGTKPDFQTDPKVNDTINELFHAQIDTQVEFKPDRRETNTTSVETQSEGFPTHSKQSKATMGNDVPSEHVPHKDASLHEKPVYMRTPVHRDTSSHEDASPHEDANSDEDVSIAEDVQILSGEWKMSITHKGRFYYIDHNNQTTIWERPTHKNSTRDPSTSKKKAKIVDNSLPRG